jgi:hypothetical protein
MRKSTPDVAFGAPTIDALDEPEHLLPAFARACPPFKEKKHSEKDERR